LLLGILLPKKDNLIIFESFLGKQYSDNPRALYEYLRSNYSSFQMIWRVERNSLEHFSNYDVRYVRRFSLRWLYVMNRYKSWLSNTRIPLWVRKPKKTIYVQTRHGTPLKKLDVNMQEVHTPGTNTGKYRRNLINAIRKWD